MNGRQAPGTRELHRSPFCPALTIAELITGTRMLEGKEQNHPIIWVGAWSLPTGPNCVPQVRWGIAKTEWCGPGLSKGTVARGMDPASCQEREGLRRTLSREVSKTLVPEVPVWSGSHQRKSCIFFVRDSPLQAGSTGGDAALCQKQGKAQLLSFGPDLLSSFVLIHTKIIRN